MLHHACTSFRHEYWVECSAKKLASMLVSLIAVVNFQKYPSEEEIRKLFVNLPSLKRFTFLLIRDSPISDEEWTSSHRIQCLLSYLVNRRQKRVYSSRRESKVGSVDMCYDMPLWVADESVIITRSLFGKLKILVSHDLYLFVGVVWYLIQAHSATNDCVRNFYTYFCFLVLFPVPFYSYS